MLPDWDTSSVREVETVVTVDGVVRPHVSASWGQDLASALPEQVAAVGKHSQRTGTIVWHRQTRGGDVIAISGTKPSPWRKSQVATDEWIPKAGQAVTVDAVDGKGNLVRCFTGLIDDVDGDGAGGLQSAIVDRIDDFNRTVQVEALTEVGVPWKDDGTRRWSGASCAWTVDDILRQCGYYSTPPKPPGLILDAPMQGSTYVYAEPPTHSNAQMTDSGGYTGEVDRPQWAGGGEFTGLALRDARVQYIPYSGGGSGESALRVSLMVHPNHRDPASVEVVKTNGAVATLWVDGSKKVRVGTRPSGGHAVTADAFTLPQSTDVLMVSAIFRDGTVDVASSFGQAATLNLRTPVGVVQEINVLADYQAAIAGVQVSDPGADGGHLATTWTPTAVVRYGWHVWPQKVTPSIRGEMAKDALTEFAEALLSPVHLDEYGVARVAGTDDLISRPSRIMVDTISGVADMTWSLSLRDIRDRVEIEWDDVRVSLNTERPHASILLWQGSGESVNQWDRVEETIEVPDNEEWIGADLDVKKLHTSSNLTDPETVEEFSAGRGSFYGGTGDGDTWGDSGAVAERFTQVSPWELTRVVAVNGDMTLKVPESTWVPKRLWGTSLPIIRGKGKVARHPSVMSRAASTGTRTLSHKMGRWCTQSGHALTFRDWLFGQVTVPHPVVRGLVVRFDPRINVGASIMVDSRQLHGVAIQGLVVSVDHDPSAGTSSLVVRVIEARSELGTYGDLEAAWSGASYETVQAAWAAINGTYGDVEADPLWRGYNR